MNQSSEGPSHTHQLGQDIDTLQTYILRLEQSLHDGITLPPDLHETLKQLAMALWSLQAASESMDQQDAARTTARQRYQEFFDFAPDAYLVTDLQGIVQEANLAATSLLHIGRLGLLGTSLMEFVAPTDRHNFQAQLVTLAAGGRLSDWEVTVQPWQHPPVPAACSVAPARTPTGQVVWLNWLVRDISARKRAEAEHRASEARFRMLVEGVQDYAIYLLDPRGHVVSWNAGAERLKGYRMAEILGQSFSRFFPPDDQARGIPEQLLKRAVQDGHYVGEGWRVRQDGSRFWASVVLTALWNERGQLQGFAKVTRDITERREAEAGLMQAKAQLEQRVEERTAALQASLEEKEVLLKEIHHRVKNNLQIISSLLSLQAGEHPSREVHSFIQQSQARIHAMALIHETLYQSEGLAHVDLAAYVRGLAAQFFRSAGLEDSPIAVQVEAETVRVPIDTATPCGLILNELLSNALKHAFPAGQTGSIRLTLRKDADRRVTLQVQDTGVGLPPEVDPRDTPSLGLQLVYSLAEQLDGTLTVTSQGGTTVTLTFPT